MNKTILFAFAFIFLIGLASASTWSNNVSYAQNTTEIGGGQATYTLIYNLSINGIVKNVSIDAYSLQSNVFAFVKFVLVHSDETNTSLINSTNSLTYTTLKNNNLDFNYIKRVEIYELTSPNINGDRFKNVNITYIKNSTVQIVSPVNNAIQNNYLVTLNSTATVTGGATLVNMSLYDNSTGSWGLRNTTSLTGTSNTTTWNNTYATGQSYLWGVKACDSDGACGWSENRTFSIDTAAPSITVLSPTGNQGYLYNGKNITLNYSISDTNLQSCWFEYNNTNNSIPCATNYSFLQADVSKLSGKIWANDTVGNKGYANVNWSYDIFENSQTYNSSTYETAQETFSINATGMTTASLIYAGAVYPVTVSNGIATKTIDIPTVSTVTTRTFYWNINSLYNSTSYNQTVSPVILTLCNATYNVPYINFTYKDENTLNNIRANSDLATWVYYLGSGAVTKTYIYQNATANASSTAFCFSPSNRSITASLTYQYSGTGYPQRYYTTSGSLSNATINQTLYLLASADGIYSTFIVDNTAFAPLSGATIKVYRDFSGTSTLISQGVTGSDGGATFWLNPNYDHTLVITASGYASKTVTVRPTQSTYTIQMASSSGNASFSQYLPGAKWYYYPAQQILYNNTVYTFGMNLNYSEGGLVDCRVQLTDMNGTELQSVTGCGSYGGNINFSYNTGNNTKIVLHFYATLPTGEVVLDPIAYWVNIPTNSSSFKTLKGFIQQLSSITVDFGGDPLRQSFTRIVIFFFLLTIILSALNLYTGIEFSNNGLMPFVLWGLVLVFSIGGFFNLPYYSDSSSLTNPIWVSTWFTKYAVASLATLFIIGFSLNKFTRENS